MNIKPIMIVQGAQWGSEGKGMVAAALCQRREVDYAVRTGAVNAGHTVYHKGIPYKMQQLPTGWVNPRTTLVIGPGAYVNPAILAAEISTIREAGARNPVIVDWRAGLHLDTHTARAKESGREYRIGATGKGCSEAIVDRIKRADGTMLFKDWCQTVKYNADFQFRDTVYELHRAYDMGMRILLEGTQGTFLDLYLGPYPFTTHKQTIAAQWVTEAGLAPGMEYETVLVARTYPIRVAGNSGPMPGEMDWVDLAMDINSKLRAAGRPPMVADASLAAYVKSLRKCEESNIYTDPLVAKKNLPSDALAGVTEEHRRELMKLFETTTVTHKLRRVAAFDEDFVRTAVRINRPAWVALTFLNYVFPELWYEESIEHQGAHNYRKRIEKKIGCPIRAVTTGPRSEHFHEIMW